MGKKYCGVEVDQVLDLKSAREEIARMKSIVADLILDKPMLPDMLARKF